MPDERSGDAGRCQGRLGLAARECQASRSRGCLFSSHGSPRDLDPNGISYIILNDTDLSRSEKLYATSLQMIDLVQTLAREVHARRMVLFLDTCFSGDALHGISPGSKRVSVALDQQADSIVISVPEVR